MSQEELEHLCNFFHEIQSINETSGIDFTDKNKVSPMDNDISKTSLNVVLRMGIPNAITFKSYQDRTKFMDEIHKRYGGKFDNIDLQMFRYLFGVSDNIPENYPSKIIWSGKRTDLLILLRTLYKKDDGSRSHGLIVHIKETKNGTKWSAGTTLSEKQHKDRVNEIINLAQQFGGDTNAIDGIPWLPNYKKG